MQRRGRAALSITLVLAACLGHDPELTASSGDGGTPLETGPPDSGMSSTTDGAPDAQPELPVIDHWSYTAGTPSMPLYQCLSYTTQALELMKGSYTRVGSGHANAGAAFRRGAALFTHCVDVSPSSIVLTGAVGLREGLDARNDDTRLFILSGGGDARETPPSAPNPSLTPLRVAAGAEAPPPGLTQALCQERAKSAIEAAFASGRGRWSETFKTFLAIGGAAGTTAAIGCLGDLKAVVIHVVTLDPAIDPAIRVTDVSAELRRVNGL
jgi:hypothetical protein